MHSEEVLYFVMIPLNLEFKTKPTKLAIQMGLFVLNHPSVNVRSYNLVSPTLVKLV